MSIFNIILLTILSLHLYNRWAKKFDIFQKNKIFCPININNSHWTLLVMYIKLKKIVYYDSMGRSSCSKYLNGALRYLGDEADRLGRGFLPDEWELVPTDLNNTPQQQNGYDCGVFTIMFADFLTHNLPLSFSQEIIQLCRKKICLNIIRGYLDDQEVSLKCSSTSSVNNHISNTDPDPVI